MGELLDEEKLIRLIDKAIDRNPTILNMQREVQNNSRAILDMRQVHGQTLREHGQTLREHSEAIHDLQQEQRRQGREQHRQGLMMEDMNQKLDTILEVLAPTVKKVETLDPLADVVEQHESRIDDLESGVKTHIADKGTHKSH